MIFSELTIRAARFCKLSTRRADEEEAACSALTCFKARKLASSVSRKIETICSSAPFRGLDLLQPLQNAKVHQKSKDDVLRAMRVVDVIWIAFRCKQVYVSVCIGVTNYLTIEKPP